MPNLINEKYINSDVKNLFETVVEGGYCIGCGACASVEGSPIVMQLDEFSMLKATVNPRIVKDELNIDIQSICPFSNSSSNEDVIGKSLYEKYGTPNNKLGYYISTYAGHVLEGDFRKQGSSGGMGSWIASALLKANLVDSVIHIHQRKPTDNDKRLFHYQISTTVEEISNSAKSRYYPVELSEMISLIRSRPGKYAIVGIPCFIKSVRLLSNQDSVIADRVTFCIGLICGHLKSTRFAELFAWHCDVHPSNLQSIDFRKKLDGHGANKYGVSVTGINENNARITKVSPPINQLYGANWGFGFFKYKACDYCDDVVAETADVTIGDAWLPQYVNDSQGTNVIIIRHPVIQNLFDKAQSDNLISIESISPNEVIKSQSSGFQHRREGLAYRLFKADESKVWRPKKRVTPEYNEALSSKQDLRIEMSELSHYAFNRALEKNDFSEFEKTMRPVVRKYQILYRKPFSIRVLDKIKDIFSRVSNR